jgi:pimeloyl-ACP methyl ester carboxylesterase
MAITEASGSLLHDAKYLIRVPDGWNGVLLNDLDYAALWEETPPRSFLLDRGYALSGTSRLQALNRENIVNQISVLDIFCDQFGRPRTTIQIGCSGGGNVALMMGELHPERVDGVIPMCGASSTILRHLWLDLLFTLKALLAPEGDLPVAETPAPADTVGIEIESPAMQRWNETLDEAAETALGRARVALALTLAQYPTWAGFATDAPVPKPAPDDLSAAETAMLASSRAGVACAVAFLPAPSPRFYSNEGVDYLRFYDNADRAQRRVVRALYRAAGTDPDRKLRADLERVDRTERVASAVEAADDAGAQPHTGRPGVPTLHATTMDAAVPPVVMRGYAARARSEGRARLYRQAFVDRANHCGFSVSEIAALVETLILRLQTGGWLDRTRPEQLNALAASFGADESRFVAYRPPVLNRAIFADT